MGYIFTLMGGNIFMLGVQVKLGLLYLCEHKMGKIYKKCLGK